MTQNLKGIFTTFLCSAVFFSCYNKDKQVEEDLNEVSPVFAKDTIIFGFPPNDLDKVIDIGKTKINSFELLVNRIEQIVCNDSVPAFSIDSDSNYKTIYPVNPCRKFYGCILIKERNVMTLSKDSIWTYFDSTKPIDSLSKLLKIQIQNFGQTEFHANDYSSLLFIINDDSLNMETLKESLDRLTNVYLNETNQTDIKISIDKGVELPDFVLDSLNNTNTFKHNNN